MTLMERMDRVERALNYHQACIIVLSVLCTVDVLLWFAVVTGRF